MRTLNKSEKLKNDQTGRFGHTPRVAAVAGTRRSNPIFFIYGGARQPAGCGRPPRKKKKVKRRWPERLYRRSAVQDGVIVIASRIARSATTEIEHRSDKNPPSRQNKFRNNFGFQFNFVTENADVTASGY